MLTRVLKSICLFTLVSTNIWGSVVDREKLNQLNQEHLIAHWDSLSPDEQASLAEQIDAIDVETFYAQQQAISQKDLKPESITPFLEYVRNGSQANIKQGKQLIAQGKVGCIIVAGGQGTRLKFDGPKGIYPVTVVKKKSLFQIFAEKTLAAGIQAGRQLPLAIMTSSVNNRDTVDFFIQHDFFGLDPNQVSFFCQRDLPFLDVGGNLFLESPARIAAGPDGNAPSLKQFVDQEIWANWQQKGIQYIVYIHIDNPLADPFDAELVGFHNRNPVDLVIKCIERVDPLEKLGIILRKNGRVDVIEYSEISPEERDSRERDGSLKHKCGNVSMFSFTMNFIEDIAKNHYDQLPFHKAWKAAKYLDESGQTQMSPEPMAWKFEKFIFDVLPYAKTVKALLYPREECFAPLKNATGSDSIATVQAALQNNDRRVFAKISGTSPDGKQAFELDPQFYYPTKGLIKKWKGKSLPKASYINP